MKYSGSGPLLLQLHIGVCLRSSTSPAWPVPTERRVAGGKSIYNYYEYDLIKVEKNNVMAGAAV